MSGQVPRRVDAATKTGLLELLDEATDEGWSLRRACRQLELGELRAYRWLGRRDTGGLEDARPGGSPMHGLLEEEATQIVVLFHEWGETDRSHRKLAHRGSYLHRVWVSPSSVRKVLAAQGLRLRALPRPGRSVRKAFPDWADYEPNSIWIYDTTHFMAAGMAVVAIMDLVSRKWLTEIVSVEETSVQVAQAFTDALYLEGLDDAVAAYQDATVDPTVDDPRTRSCWRSHTTARRCDQARRGSSWRSTQSANTSADPAPPPIKPGSRPCSVTSKPNGPTYSRSATRRCCEPSSPSSGSNTTRFDSTKGSDM